MEIVEDGFAIRSCEPDDLSDAISDCLMEAMISGGDEEDDSVVVPTELSLGYSDEGGMCLKIGSLFVICDNHPPGKEEMIKLIKEVYKTTVVSIAGLPVRIGEITVVPSEHETECDLVFKLFWLQ